MILGVCYAFQSLIKSYIVKFQIACVVKLRMEGCAASLPSLRKLEFPASVTEALKLVHLQCEKMSKNSLSIPQELDQITGNNEFLNAHVIQIRIYAHSH